MRQILICDGSPLCRELLAKVLESGGFSVACAADVRSAAASLASVTPSLIILDVAIDSAKGMRFLAAMRRDVRWKDLPVLVLTDASDKHMVLRAAQLGVRDYVLKARFSLSELLTRLQCYIRPLAEAGAAAAPSNPVAAPEAASDTRTESAAQTTAATPSPAASPATASAPPPRAANAELTPFDPPKELILTREQTLQMLDEGGKLKTLPGVMAEIMALTHSPRGAISDLTQVLRRDPVMAARVLQVANSAAFTSQRPRVSSIDDAVRNIGVGGVRNMVLAVGIFESFPPDGNDGFSVVRSWQHCLAVAMLMDKLVPPSDAAPAGMAHLTGLCHDLGEIVIRQQFPDQFAAASKMAQSNGKPMPQALSQLFGMPWNQLIAAVLTKLGLPPAITTPIEEFFERGVRQQARGMGSVLARSLRFVNVYAHGLMLAPTDDAPLTPISRVEYRATFGDGPPPAIDDFVVRSEVLTASSVLSRLSNSESAKLCETIIPARNLRLAYARHASYCETDPLGAALKFAGSVQLVDLPAIDPSTLATFDGLIIAAPRSLEGVPGREAAATAARIAGNRLPVLYLAGSNPEELSGLGEKFLTLKLPIPLNSLAQWITALPQNTAAHAPLSNAA